MRDAVMLVAFACFLVLALRNTFAAYSLWAWTGVIAPSFYLFGFMQGLRYNFIFAGISLASLFFAKQKGSFDNTPTRNLLLLFALWLSLSALFAYRPNPFNQFYFEVALKSLVFCVVMPLFVFGRLRIQSFVLVLTVALGFHAAVEGLKVLVTAGGHNVRGIPSTLMADNNQFAVGMAMAMPLCYYFFNQSASALSRYAALAGMVLAVLTIIGSDSRGGFLAMGMVGIWLALASRRKVLTTFAVVALAGLVINFAPESWFDRIDTIRSADEDSSFLGRVVAWKISTAVALSNPLVGGGIHAIQAQAVWDVYKYQIGFLDFIPTPDPERTARAAHSIYFEVLGDTGVVGFAIFLAILYVAFRNARQIRRLCAGRADLLWARDLADMLRVSLAAYAVGGAGVSMAYFEFYYTLVALIEVLRQHILGTLAAESPAPSEQSVLSEQRKENHSRGAPVATGMRTP